MSGFRGYFGPSECEHGMSGAIGINCTTASKTRKPLPPYLDVLLAIQQKKDFRDSNDLRLACCDHPQNGRPPELLRRRIVERT